MCKCNIIQFFTKLKLGNPPPDASQIELPDALKKVCSLACEVLFTSLTSVATTYLGCTEDALEVVTACEIAGVGPEDPLSTACAVTMGATFLTTCISVVEKIGEFGAEQCKEHICGAEPEESKLQCYGLKAYVKNRMYKITHKSP